ncbi:MAG: phosphatidylserine decarboxylase [Cardiobacteriaceae bacterium]|nr:phosphatidylserine decarboxylase [Cardiobacteriaceae bacterium]
MKYAIYRLIPRLFLSRIFYYLARIENYYFKNSLIFIFSKITGANCDFAARKNLYEYKSLLDFFTRELADGAREINSDENAIVSPVDGRVAIYGDINNQQLFQAKNHKYSLSALLNCPIQAKKYESGKTITIYLAPDDYHRIHAPVDCVLQSMSFCPGDKHSVAINLLEKIDGLFIANERLVCNFSSARGEFSLVMVGALNVGSIATVWSGELKNNIEDGNFYFYPDGNISFKKGDEIGRFNLGSTVILCFEEGFNLQFDNPKIATKEKIHLGEKIAV